MLALWMVSLLFGGFILLFLYILWCERLSNDKKG